MPDDALPPLMACSLIQKSVEVTGSNIGSPGVIQEVLRVAAEKKVLTRVQKRSMKGNNAALGDMHDGKARYRFVLQNGGDQAGL